MTAGWEGAGTTKGGSAEATRSLALPLPSFHGTTHSLYSSFPRTREPRYVGNQRCCYVNLTMRIAPIAVHGFVADALPERSRNAGVERSAVTAGEDLDGGLLFVGHNVEE